MIKNNKQSGTILLQAFVFGTISVIMIGALVSWAGSNIKASRVGMEREQALQIAEAGVDYYRWHLAHAPTDYSDGNGTSTGPFVHDFYDKDGIKLGTFTLEIVPPATGFTLVKIKSTGRIVSDPNVSRVISVQLAKPSLAKFAVVANDDMRFGAGTEVFGPIHANGGIRFDGLAHNIITSAKDKYDDPDHSGNNEYGVHTHVVLPSGAVNDTYRAAEAPNATLQNRTDVFEAGRQFPVPAVDFVGMTTDISQIKSGAQSAGKYISNSGAQGYRIVFKTDDTFDLYKVVNLMTAPNGCSNSQNQTGWGTWSIKTTGNGNQTLVGNYPIPSNGLIFVEDNLWVEGQINSARVTVAAGKFPDNPSTRPSITINNDLLYTNYNGTDVISLISQGDINTGLTSDDNLRIDAALVAQNGRAGRYYYGSSCGTSYRRASLTLYGMIGTNGRYGFAYTDNTGYLTRDIIYDANLLYGPPPSFPLTSDQYQTVSWDETK